MEIALEIRAQLQMALHHKADPFFERLKKKFFHPSERMKTFYCLVVVGLCCFLYSWIKNQLTVPLGGDYTLQEMTFLYNGYDDWHHFFETGDFPFWDRSAFLGIDNIGGNSFYYLFDPFFLIMLIFPRDWLIYVQGFMFVPKLVISGMLFYWYLSSFDVSDKNRRIGALCYGFCGYCFGYLWFHFIDSVAFLPLTFLGIERVLRDRDPRILLVGFLLNALTSYFFFVVFMIGAFLYAIFRFFQTMKTRTFEEQWAAIGVGVFSFVMGIFLAGITLLPGMYMAISMPRVSSSDAYLTTLFESQSLKEFIDNFFTYPATMAHNQITPLLNFLFMPDNCYYSNLLNVSWYDNLASSIYATTPLLLLFFVGLVEAIKNKRFSYLFGMFFTLFLIFTPIGFYLFSGFTVAYARYFIIPTSWMIVFDILTLQRRREIKRSSLDLSFAFVMILDAICGFLIVYAVNKNPNYFPSSTYWDLKMIEIPLSMAWVLVCYLVMRPLFHKAQLSKAMIALCSVDIAVMANVTIIFQGTVDINSMAGGPDNIAEETKIVTLLKESEGNDFYRLFSPTADRGNINISMRIGYNGLGSFHSVYAFEAQDFIDRSRIPYTSGNWSMGMHNRRENMETFLGTKYYLVPKVDLGYEANEVPFSDYDIPYGYVNVLDLTQEEKEELGVDYSSELLDYLASDSCDKSLYVNLNFVDFAFPFDTVINTAWLATGADSEGKYYWGRYEDVNEYPLLRYGMLDNEDFLSFQKEKLFHAGTYTANGKTTNIAEDSTNASSLFYNSMITSNYREGDSAPIERYAGSTRLKVEVYSANWPATKSNPSGEYAYMNPEDPYDNEGREEYDKEHPFLAANGIGPADDHYDYDTLKDEEGKTSDKYQRKVLYNSKLVLTFENGGESVCLVPEADPNDPSTGAYLSIDSSNNISWRLFDEEGKLISIAQHSYSDYQRAHGYYVDRPVKTIVGVIRDGTKDNPVNIDRPEIYIIRNKDYQEAIDKLREEPVEIVKRDDDNVYFHTSYESAKFVVLNYPRQAGWKLYRHTEDEEGNEIKEEVETYKAQGGFIGFVCPSGEGSYSLEYKSPYFSLGLLMTGIGLVATLLCLYGYDRLSKTRRFEKEELNRLKYIMEREIRMLDMAKADMEDQG